MNRRSSTLFLPLFISKPVAFRIERKREIQFQEWRIRVTSSFSIAPLPKEISFRKSPNNNMFPSQSPQHILHPHLPAQYSQIDSPTLSRVPWKFTDFRTVEKSFEPPVRYPISHTPTRASNRASLELANLTHHFTYDCCE